MINLILCGGAGTRLWPISRKAMPKQFYPLFSGKSLFEKTIERNAELCSEFWIASNEVQVELAYHQLEGLGRTEKKGLIEPIGRNTAPAIALACLQMEPETLVLVSPSDHLVTKIDDYDAAVRRAKSLAKEGKLVTFGLKPLYPETGFGYIEADEEKVLSFKEKPKVEVAQAYIDQGNFWWNSGIFVFQAGVYLEELKTYSPEIFSACERAWKNAAGSVPLRVSQNDMEAIPSFSIDHAVMEGTMKAAVVTCDIGWSDVGSFDALFDEIYNAASGNAVMSEVSPILIDAENNLVISDRQVALVGVSDLLIVDAKDALLVVKRGSSQRVKEVVEELGKELR